MNMCRILMVLTVQGYGLECDTEMKMLKVCIITLHLMFHTGHTGTACHFKDTSYAYCE